MDTAILFDICLFAVPVDVEAMLFSGKCACCARYIHSDGTSGDSVKEKAKTESASSGPGTTILKVASKSNPKARSAILRKDSNVSSNGTTSSGKGKKSVQKLGEKKKTSYAAPKGKETLQDPAPPMTVKTGAKSRNLVKTPKPDVKIDVIPDLANRLFRCVNCEDYLICGECARSNPAARRHDVGHILCCPVVQADFNTIDIANGCKDTGAQIRVLQTYIFQNVAAPKSDTIRGAENVDVTALFRRFLGNESTGAVSSGSGSTVMPMSLQNMTQTSQSVNAPPKSILPAGPALALNQNSNNGSQSRHHLVSLREITGSLQKNVGAGVQPNSVRATGGTSSAGRTGNASVGTANDNMTGKAVTSSTAAHSVGDEWVAGFGYDDRLDRTWDNDYDWQESEWENDWVEDDWGNDWAYGNDWDWDSNTGGWGRLNSQGTDWSAHHLQNMNPYPPVAVDSSSGVFGSSGSGSGTKKILSDMGLSSSGILHGGKSSASASQSLARDTSKVKSACTTYPGLFSGAGSSKTSAVGTLSRQRGSTSKSVDAVSAKDGGHASGKSNVLNTAADSFTPGKKPTGDSHDSARVTRVNAGGPNGSVNSGSGKLSLLFDDAILNSIMSRCKDATTVSPVVGNSDGTEKRDSLEKCARTGHATKKTLPRPETSGKADDQVKDGNTSLIPKKRACHTIGEPSARDKGTCSSSNTSDEDGGKRAATTGKNASRASGGSSKIAGSTVTEDDAFSKFLSEIHAMPSAVGGDSVSLRDQAEKDQELGSSSNATDQTKPAPRTGSMKRADQTFEKSSTPEKKSGSTGPRSGGNHEKRAKTNGANATCVNANRDIVKGTKNAGATLAVQDDDMFTTLMNRLKKEK